MTDENQSRQQQTHFCHSSRPDGGSGTQERERILTMKYGKQQMMLIKKRLRIEMWLLEQLEELYEDEDQALHCEIDIDQLLDINSDEDRIMQLKAILADCKAPIPRINEFVNEVIEKLKTL